jgi:hypothetical protein
MVNRIFTHHAEKHRAIRPVPMRCWPPWGVESCVGLNHESGGLALGDDGVKATRGFADGNLEAGFQEGGFDFGN